MPHTKRNKHILVVIFGATGDLTARKLLPALTNLYSEDFLPENSRVIALGRRDFTTSSYIDFVKSKNTKVGNLDLLHDFLMYKKIDILNDNDYEYLKVTLDEICHEDTLRLFYLAVAPDLFIPIANSLATHHVAVKNNHHHLLAFEKPFGKDLESAKNINQTLQTSFSEKQIFRIDHYLGKEMIQNLLTVRFANRIVESSWNNEDIEMVKIYAKEDESILDRGAYYDENGALRDVIQNHLLQIVSLIGVETPLSLKSEDIKAQKVKVLQNIRVDYEASLLGQYEGYSREKHVKSGSTTETLAFIKLYVDTPLFSGVPFYLYTGKMLDEKRASIEIVFKKTKLQEQQKIKGAADKLIIDISPESSVKLVINGKEPGFEHKLSQVGLEYCYSCQFPNNVKEAYEKLFIDMFKNSKTLFTRWDEIELAWKVIDDIKEHVKMMITYKDHEQVMERIRLLNHENL
ncbi:MAG: glucose-6-phosphate dehydrogenase [Bacilli bacterium]